MPKSISAILFCFLLILKFSYGITFTSLSVETPVKLAFVSELSQLATFRLQFNPSELTHDIFIRIDYIIDKDTVTDYYYVDENFQGNIKEIKLLKGSTLTANLYLHTQGLTKLDSIKGEFTYKFSPINETQEIDGIRKFTGTIWQANEQVLFRINKQDIKKQKVEIAIKTTENYAYDQLFLKVKAVSPVDGIILLDKTITVNKGAQLDYISKSVMLALEEFKMAKEGNYYIQITQQMAAPHLNGIESISYKLIDL